MSVLDSKVKKFLVDDRMPFEALNNGSSYMSVEKFESEFGLIAAVELPDIGQYTYYYRNHTTPNLIMQIRVTENKLNAILGSYAHFEKRLQFILNS